MYVHCIYIRLSPARLTFISQSNSEALNLVMLNWLLREKFLNLVHLEKLERRLNNPVEQERKVDEQDKANNLQPLERLPAKTERDNPDEQGAASVDGRPRGSADAACNRYTEKVETTARDDIVSQQINKRDKPTQTKKALTQY